MHRQRPAVAILVRNAGAGGSVGRVALRQARELAVEFRPIVVSDKTDNVRSECSDLEVIEVPLRDFSRLRGLAHVPTEVFFDLDAGKVLGEIEASGSLAFVLCHAHAGVVLAGRSLRKTPIGLVTHGDVFDRAPGTYDRWLTLFYRYVTPRAYKRSDLIVALSPHMRDLALARGGADDRVSIIPNGIDPDELLEGNAADRWPRGSLRLLFAGRLAPEKGPDLALRALSELRSEGLDAHLLMAGQGPMQAELEALAVDLGLSARSVTFLGRVPRPQLGPLFSGADLLVAPSRSDPMPLAVLESLAMGLPVIGASVGGISYAVEDGKSGLLFPPDDLQAMKRAILKAADPRQHRRFSDAAKESALTRFSWDQVGARLRRAIRRAVATAQERHG